jgi:uncharacterized protein
VSLSLYDISVPVMVRHLGILATLIDIGRRHVEAQGGEPRVLLEARLAEDMLTLIGQVQRASDTAKFVAVRVAGVDNVAMADEEASFDDLEARIRATVAFLEKVPREAFDGCEAAEVTLQTGSGKRSFAAKDYLLEFALPNFFFHVTTAYDILRNAGVPVGKRDYLGWR